MKVGWVVGFVDKEMIRPATMHFTLDAALYRRHQTLVAVWLTDLTPALPQGKGDYSTSHSSFGGAGGGWLNAKTILPTTMHFILDAAWCRRHQTLVTKQPADIWRRAPHRSNAHNLAAPPGQYLDKCIRLRFGTPTVC